MWEDGESGTRRWILARSTPVPGRWPLDDLHFPTQFAFDPLAPCARIARVQPDMCQPFEPIGHALQELGAPRHDLGEQRCGRWP